MGLRPVTPHREAGCLIEPPVSVPVTNGAMPAASAAAEPPELPPGTQLRSQGFLTAPKKLVSLEEPIANSSILHLPSITAPSACILETTVASYAGINCSSMREPQVVLTPLVQKISLCSRGMPVSEAMSPLAMALSASRALSIACSEHVVMTAFSAPL